MEEIIVVGIVVVVCLLLDGIILGLAKVLPKKNPTDLKYLRYEAGNIPLGVPKWTLPMQYYGFMVMFMALEPVVVLLLIFSVFPSISSAFLLAIALVMFLPAIYLVYDYAVKIANRRDVYE
jgi:NADH-quinone oxidoreductase subunit A